MWRSHAAFMKYLTGDGRSVNILWAFPGFQLHNIVNDWMHVCDLGALQYTLGNSLGFLFIRLKGVRSRNHPFCKAMTFIIKTASKGL